MSEQAINETTYLFTTIGAGTERGGRVTRVSTNATIDNLGLAVVGDIVAYEEGTEAMIVDGAGFAVMWHGRPVMTVTGSHLSNGDRIVTAARDACDNITVRDGEEIPRLFEPAYSPILADVVRTGGGGA
ncbi:MULTISPECIES: PAAR domain-containing protein [Burkholderia]|uniref:PAAR domain-containing protein n=1 Tax=Burkholderia TaxID=32008 RepID=UPI000752940A|nr:MULTISPECIES: PAAR domain-containing protein [Burkholderia]AOJ88147.1 hypothetical protein WS87_16435 [Burkholderia sp. MSMB0856]KVH31928.1 hypothetical protein WS87_24250 [Burkholderia sp. MSMB0856]